MLTKAARARQAERTIEQSFPRTEGGVWPDQAIGLTGTAALIMSAAKMKAPARLATFW